MAGSLPFRRHQAVVLDGGPAGHGVGEFDEYHVSRLSHFNGNPAISLLHPVCCLHGVVQKIGKQAARLPVFHISQRQRIRLNGKADFFLCRAVSGIVQQHIQHRIARPHHHLQLAQRLSHSLQIRFRLCHFPLSDHGRKHKQMIFHVMRQLFLLLLLPDHQIVLPVDHLLLHFQGEALLLLSHVFRVK